MSPNRIFEVVKPFFVVGLGIFVLSVVYSVMMNNDYDDSFEVTFSYDCNKVLFADRDYPSEVVAACLELRDEIKARNRH